tara:strand:+ start:165 stop:548 length:384 start_codon:yes stop_codon:yes gene_type:complete
MGMSANTDENPYGQVLGSNDGVPVYRLPQNFRGALQQDATSSAPYGQILGMPTIRPYPFQDPRFQFDNFQLTPLSTQMPKVPHRPPPVSTQVQQNKNRQPGAKQQNSLGQKQIRRREDMPNFMGNIR